MGITVAQVLEIERLRSSLVLAGRTGLQRTLEQVVLLDGSPPTNPPHHHHDQVLYLTGPLARLDDAQSQCASIATLAAGRSAGLVYQPARMAQLAPEALALADRLTFPLIEVPAGLPPAEIITVVMTAVMHERAAVLDRQRMFQQQLIDLMLRGFGLDHLVRATAERLRRPILVLGAHDDSESAYGLDEAQRQQWQLLVARSRPARPRIFELPSGGQVSVHPLPGTQRPGWLVVRHDPGFGQEQRQTIEQACAIIALDLIKHETVAAAQRNRQGELLDTLLAGRFESEEQLLQAAGQIGWDLRRCRAVLIVRATGALEPLGRLQSPLRLVGDVVRRASPQSIVCQRGDDVLVLASLSPGPAALRELAESIHATLIEHDQRSFVIASGSLADSPLGLTSSHRAALGALRLRLSLPGAPPVVHYEDAQLLILLSDFADRAEVQSWLQAQLGTLIDYDRRNKTALVQTLEAALDHGGVLTTTAEQLNIHPNTLKYRLQRIEEIIEHNPLSSPYRLAYHIAAKLARLRA